MNEIPACYRLVLASASPRRRDILKDAGYVFEVADPGDVEESVVSSPTPEALAMEKAKVKAQAIAGKLAPPFPAMVIGVDTLCVLGDKVIGKPLDRADARDILSRLSGTRHRVISGLCLLPVRSPGVPPGPEKLVSATTWVTLRKMSRAEIDEYVDSGESDGKAGAYAIQEKGDRFVTSVDGSFLNVVGFPLEVFRDELKTGLKLQES